MREVPNLGVEAQACSNTQEAEASVFFFFLNKFCLEHKMGGGVFSEGQDARVIWAKRLPHLSQLFKLERASFLG